jgi:S1-C subfamily serine protease
MRSHSRLLISATALLLAGLACNLFTVTPPPAPTPAAVLTVAPPPTVAAAVAPPVTSAEEQSLIDLYRRMNPSVVAILVEGNAGGALGTGFVFDAEGHVVTNYHVVEGAQNIEVDFPSGFKTRGQVLGTDADSDLAVIKLETLPEQLAPAPLGDSDQIQVGERVVAIGNPFGLSGTMTIGIISGLGRTLTSVRTTDIGTFSAPDIIQTDAAINPGNSGGPLLNMQGEVIGVNKALESQTGINSGIGFAVASNTVKQIVPYLIKDGKFVYPYLGITAPEELSLLAQERLKLPQASGAYVTSVVPNGPSDQAGLKADTASATSADFNGDGDLIVAIDGHDVKVFSDLLSYLVNHTRPGQEVTLTVLRGGEKLDVKVTLGERP